MKNWKPAQQLAHRYLKLCAFNESRCSYENNLTANFIQCSTGHFSSESLEELLKATEDLIGSGNYIAATLYHRLADDHIQHQRTKQAEQFYRRSASLWELAGVTQHPSLSRCM